jgi:hypothetical protein
MQKALPINNAAACYIINNQFSMGIISLIPGAFAGTLTVGTFACKLSVGTFGGWDADRSLCIVMLIGNPLGGTGWTARHSGHGTLPLETKNQNIIDKQQEFAQVRKI